MGRHVRLAACAATVVAVTLIAWHTRRTAAEPVTSTPGRTTKPASPQLPIAQVVLFSSGVGYFQREGDVEGNARIDLSYDLWISLSSSPKWLGHGSAPPAGAASGPTAARSPQPSSRTLR